MYKIIEVILKTIHIYTYTCLANVKTTTAVTTV